MFDQANVCSETCYDCESAIVRGQNRCQFMLIVCRMTRCQALWQENATKAVRSSLAPHQQRRDLIVHMPRLRIRPAQIWCQSGRICSVGSPARQLRTRAIRLSIYRPESSAESSSRLAARSPLQRSCRKGPAKWRLARTSQPCGTAVTAMLQQ